MVAQNYRDPEDLRKDIRFIKENNSKPFGVNVVLNNPKKVLARYINICCDEKVGFVISSLGDPGELIRLCKPREIKVFCDVTNSKHAVKAVSRGADAIIAVNNQAGGHAGQFPAEELLPDLIRQFEIPVISAGGVSDHVSYRRIMDLGAAGVSVGTPFIATNESLVTDDYKNAIVKSAKTDVVFTKRLSGINVAVIRTPYVDAFGQKPTVTEKILTRHKGLRRLVKKILRSLGLSKFELKITGPDYSKVFCAGPSLENINKIAPVKEVVNQIVGG